MLGWMVGLEIFKPTRDVGTDEEVYSGTKNI